MSADLTDPDIAAAVRAIDSKSATWLLLHYPSSQSSASQIVYHASGPSPVAQGWREVIAGGTDDVLFGYGEIEGKGLILLYLSDRVGGVRRARAVVHSRAIAQLFPDYQAFLTISDPSQLSDDILREKLGINQVTTTHTSSSISEAHSAPISFHHRLPPIPTAAETPGPSQSGQHIPTSVSNQFSDSPHDLQTSSSTAAQPSQSEQPATFTTETKPPDVDDNHHPVSDMSARDLAPPIQWGDNADPTSSSIQDSAPGLSSPPPDNHDETPRNRSLTSRFKALPFRSSSNSHPAPSTPPVQSPTSESSPVFDFSPQTPSSPTSSRFKASSLAKAFRRRRRSSGSGGTATPPGSVPASPHVPDSGMSDAPAVPPKDSFSRQPDNHGLFGQGTGEPVLAAPIGMSGGDGREEIMRHPSGAIGYTPQTVAPARGLSSSTTLDSQRIVTEKIELQPSPSASKALAEVRQKHVLQEGEIQEKFRRDQEDWERSKRAGTGASSNREAVVLDEDEGLPYDREDHGDSNSIGHSASSPPALDNVTTTPLRERPKSLSTLSPEDQAAADRLAAAALAHAERVKADREAEEARVEAEKVEIERRRTMELAEAEARRAEEDRIHRAELERLEAEREALRLDEEREAARREAQRVENERMQAEHARQQQLEAEARARKAEEEKRLAEEEALRAKAEAERKEGIKAGLVKGKREGSIMLSGWVTVQTVKTMIWRRRWFQLYPTELRLYKAEHDETPIQSIPLSSAATVSQTYEESQVIGSFKLVSENTDFYMFTDSAEDKEVVLEGLNIAIS